jgi:muconolactone delta-isomerase
MRFLVIATTKFPAPPEMVPALIDAGEKWQASYTDKLEAFGLFPGGGGFGIADVSDEAELHRIILENPFTPFSDYEIKVIVDAPTAWQQAREAFAAMTASA